jgi:hypothetical protein
MEDRVAMRKLSALALIAVALWGGDARAVDIKNIRATYGPFGAFRPGNELLPGDVFIINFDIVDITIDAKTGATKYTMTLEVSDPNGKQVVKETTNKGLLVGLGGKVVPDVVHVLLGADQMPGKYTVKVTISDPANKSKKELVQELKVLQPGFGFIHILAPAMGLKGQDYAVEYALVGMGRDKKNFPKITLTVRVLDESGMPTLTEPVVNKIPDDLPSLKVDKQELIRVVSGIYLNRPGRFTVVIEAVDDLTKKSAKISYPLTVIDPAGK